MKQMLEAVKYDLAYTKGQTEKKAAFSEKNKVTKKGFKHLPKHVQLMVLNASSTNALEATSEPTETYSEFLEQKMQNNTFGIY